MLLWSSHHFVLFPQEHLIPPFCVFLILSAYLPHLVLMQTRTGLQPELDHTQRTAHCIK